MEYRDVRALISRELYDSLEKRLPMKECPVCKRAVTMVTVYVEEGTELELGLPVEKWRCMNCLGLFSEKLVKEG